MKFYMLVAVVVVLSVVVGIVLNPVVSSQGEEWRVVLMNCNGTLGGTYNGGRDDRFFSTEAEAKSFAEGQVHQQYDYAYVSLRMPDHYVLWTLADDNAACFDARYHQWQMENIRR